MLKIYYNISPFTNYHHFENQLRIDEPIKYLMSMFHENIFINQFCKTDEELIVAKNFLNLYDPEYITRLKSICDDLKEGQIYEGDTYFSKVTFKEIMDCAFIMKNVCDDIMSKKIKFAYCLIRPPSHHSSVNKFSGFCMVNQTYQTAKYLHDNFKKKIFILDYDVHHGDGTQSLINLALSKEIYFCSIHFFSKTFYPGTGKVSENNEKVFNIPLPKQTNELTYFEKFNNIVKPYLEKVNPDIVIVSNGLDAHVNDIMKVMKLTNNFYIEVSKYLKSLNKPLIYILEGGYNPNVISEVSKGIIDVLL